MSRTKEQEEELKKLTIEAVKDKFAFRRIRAGNENIVKDFATYDNSKLEIFKVSRTGFVEIFSRFKEKYSDLFKYNKAIREVMNTYIHAKEDEKEKIKNDALQWLKQAHTGLYHTIVNVKDNKDKKFLKNLNAILEIEKSGIKHEINSALREHEEILADAQNTFNELTKLIEENPSYDWKEKKEKLVGIP